MTAVPTQSHLARAKAAIDGGDLDEAKRLIDRGADQWVGLQRYSIDWIAHMLTYVADHLGEAAVEEALRGFGDEILRERRATGSDWSGLPAETRARVIARAMLANGGAVEVVEDDEKIVLSFRCGTGGRLIDDEMYRSAGGPLAELADAAPRTFGRSGFPVYCVHCAVNNEIQAVEWGGVPYSVEFPPESAGDRCVHHVYKDTAAAPAETWVRIGKEAPS